MLRSLSESYETLSERGYSKAIDISIVRFRLGCLVLAKNMTVLRQPSYQRAQRQAKKRVCAFQRSMIWAAVNRGAETWS
jgi:hypothetical protein